MVVRASSGLSSSALVEPERHHAVLPSLPSGFCVRPRLLRLMDLYAQLSILRAPVGYGRSSLVNDWARRLDPTAPLVWISAQWLTGGFWDHLAAALSSQPTFGSSGVPPQDSAADLVRHLLQRPGPEITVIIDDLDVLDPDIDASLMALLRACGRLRLVVCLADAERLTMPLRDDVDVVELGSADLAFTREETTQLADKLVGHLSPDLTAAVQDELGGWPGPVRSVLVGLARTPEQDRQGATVTELATASLRELLGEVGISNDPATLVLALPDRCDMDIVRSIDVPDVDRAYDRLTASGLTVTDRGGHHRLAPALRRSMVDRLMSEHPELVRRTHRNLASHFAAQNRPVEELRHAVGTRDWSLVVAAVDRSWGSLFTNDRSQVRSALAEIPLDLLRGHPRAQIARAMVLGLPDAEIRSVVDMRARSPEVGTPELVETDTAMMVASRVRGLWDRAGLFADRVASGASRVQQSGPLGAARFPVRMLQVGLTRILLGDITGALPSLRTAHREAHTGDRPYVAQDAASKMACALAVRGDLVQARHWLDEFWQRQAPYGSITAWIRTTALVGQVLVSGAELDDAGADEAIAELQTTPENQEFWGWRLHALVRHALCSGATLWARQRLADARELFRPNRAEGLLMPVAGGFADALLAADEADVLTALGQGGQAQQLLAGMVDHPVLRPARARLSLLCGDAEQAEVWSSRGLEDQLTGPGAVAELLLVRALARQRMGECAGALDDLRQATQVVRGTGTMNVLRTVPRGELASLATDHPPMLELLEDPRLVEHPDLFPAVVELVELTERETVLLSLLEQGDSLQSMATQLFVSINTLKSQRRSLYAKLGVSSRQQALSRARDLGLLDCEVLRYGWARSLRRRT